MPTDVVFLSGDLMFAPRVAARVADAGLALRAVASPAAAVQLVESESPRLLIIDLETTGLAISEFVSEISEPTRPPILAFAPHVHRQRLESARQAGCDLVVSRGQFSAELSTLLTRCLAEDNR